MRKVELELFGRPLKGNNNEITIVDTLDQGGEDHCTACFQIVTWKEVRVCVCEMYDCIVWCVFTH